MRINICCIYILYIYIFTLIVPLHLTLFFKATRNLQVVEGYFVRSSRSACISQRVSIASVLWSRLFQFYDRAESGHLDKEAPIIQPKPWSAFSFGENQWHGKHGNIFLVKIWKITEFGKASFQIRSRVFPWWNVARAVTIHSCWPA